MTMTVNFRRGDNWKAFFAYLRKYRARTAETFQAQIVESRPDGNYNCLNTRTGCTFIASPADATVLAPGQLVIVARPDGSLRSSGGEYSIVGILSTNIRNASSSQFMGSEDTVAPTLSRIMSGGVEVLFVTLTHGGAAVTIEIYGTSLTNNATYGDPGITDDVVQDHHGGEVRLTIQVKALVGVAKGVYSLTVAGLTIPDFFRVV